MPSTTPIFTIGHSTRALADFLALLRAHEIRQVADVRAVPRSRRHPHFDIASLDSALAEAGVRYRHFPSLGGLRKARADSTNTAWQHPGFRGYADYMETDLFQGGLELLMAFSAATRTAVMCAEAVWWRCHRRLLADALLVRGVTVQHILSDAKPKPHELSEFARADAAGVSYPGLV